uniref:Fibrinogen C-terminal domain-containing protein n=1 Tax=Anopheles farauti TaxID=69004 RepID=A0A182QP17_9DIPT
MITDDIWRSNRKLLLVVVVVLAVVLPGRDATTETPAREVSGIADRLTALENRLTMRDEELAKMLHQVLANQQTIISLLLIHQAARGNTSFATDGTQQFVGLGTSAGGQRGNATGAAYQEAIAAYPRSCREIPDGMSGEETIYPDASASHGPGTELEVYCDQDFEDGGWIVIQNRFDGFVNFNRSWEKYRDGFGDIGTEYWLGLEEIHRLTVAVPHELAFVAESFRGERRWARYSLFEIGGETDRYRLQKLGVYSGTLGDEFTYNKGMEFSTYDHDHDHYADVNCALRTASGWWHRSCTRTNLNGLYGNESGVRFAYWLDWLHLQGLKRTRIMIREIKKRRK